MTASHSTFAYTKAVSTIVFFEDYASTAKPPGTTFLKNDNSWAVEEGTQSEKRGAW